MQPVGIEQRGQPAVPALSELGAEFGLHTHRSATDAVVARMAAPAQAALADPAVRRRLGERGTTPRGTPPADCAALVTAERARRLGVARDGNVRADQSPL
jgi:tripartite-type tricarboxylate transporter receptor subunit TctC